VAVPASEWRASAPSFAVPESASAGADGDDDGDDGGDGGDATACSGHWRSRSSYRCSCIPVRPLRSIRQENSSLTCVSIHR